MQEFLLHLQQGWRLAFGRRVNLEKFSPSLLGIINLLAALLFINFFNDFFAQGIASIFNRYAVADMFLYWGVSLLLLTLVAALYGEHNAGRFVLLVVSAWVPISLFSVIYNFAVEQNYFYAIGEQYASLQTFFAYFSWGLWWLILVWEAYVTFRALSLCFPVVNKLIVLLTAMVLPLAMTWVYFFFSDYPQLFYKPVAEDKRPKINVENVYYRQYDLLMQQLNNVTEQTNNQTDFYFVSYAPYANQDVFMREVAYVKQTIHQRISIDNKSVELLTHKDHVDSKPLANSKNLIFALGQLNKKIKSNEDVLLLYFTSHGSKQAKLAASLWPVQPNDLTVNDLDAMLDDYTDTYKIIIISACYSGSFIEQLKDENTLIITAAAKDKTSFGCSNDRELTYFAEAYFKHAWPQGKGFVETFEIAKAWVAEKELAEELVPSEPQIFIGKNIAEKLKKIDRY